MEWPQWLTGARPEPEPLVERSGSGSGDAVSDAISDRITELAAARRNAFTIEEARKIPAVARALSIISSQAMSFTPLAYRGGVAMPSQPRIVTNPMAYGDRSEFVSQTVLSLAEYGCAFWRVMGADDDPSRSAFVIPHGEVNVQWVRKPIVRKYQWNSTELDEGREIEHISIGRRAGELHGRGPLYESLDMLYPVWEAEQFAANYFTTGGIPEIVLKVAQTMTKEEALLLKEQWIETHATPGPTVASGGADIEIPGADPQKAQLQAARSYGAQVAATIFGIPAALLFVTTTGATITYTNPAGALEEVVKTTVAPLYLGPIERAWSRLVPTTQTVRFDLADMQRADIGARFGLYAIGIDKGFMTVEESRANEGWGPLPDGTPDNAHQFDPTPDNENVPIPAEVPRG